MHYTSGSGMVAAFGIGALIPGDDTPQVIARVLLDLAGLLFGLYLLVIAGLNLAGMRLRQVARTADPRTADPRTGEDGW